jgi:ABC-2 type transport system permease protein
VVTFIVPARYFVALVKGIFLRGVGLEVMWPDVLFLALFALLVIAIAIRTTRKHLA